MWSKLFEFEIWFAYWCGIEAHKDKAYVVAENLDSAISSIRTRYPHGKITTIKNLGEVWLSTEATVSEMVKRYDSTPHGKVKP